MYTHWHYDFNVSACHGGEEEGVKATASHLVVRTVSR